ncbi:MAG TPA: SusC/RagA family TonB-linked outer membrane protein, partial [Flavobacteriaceae bacterium]
MMRTFIFLCCATVFSLAPRHAGSQNEKIRIHADQEQAVDAVFDMIIAQTDYLVIYHKGLFKDFPRVQLKKGTISLYKLLKQSLSTGDLNVIVTKDNTILIKEKSSNDALLQQQVSGTVTNPSGLPLPGATVLIKGTNTGTTTNFDGSYNLTVPNPENVLVFSFLGFETQEITVGNHLPAGQAGTTINVSLKESISALDEVIIKGYYNTTQREQTGSVAKIDAKAIEKQPVENPLAAMQGYLPGVNITQQSGVPGGSFNIEIRGRNSLNSRANEPLYIIDGVPYSNESLLDIFLEGRLLNHGNSSPFVSPLNVIDPSSIQSIEVLKDADATAIYGARGANGVVLITTKKGKVGKTQIKLNMATSLGDVPHFMELLSTEQYLDMRWEGLANDGYTPETVPQSFKDTNPDLFLWDQDRYTDWQKVFFGGTAYRHTANLSFSGGNENTQFLFSGGYLSETSITPGDSEYKKATMHTSINHQSTNERLKVNVAIDYGMDDNNQPAASIAQLVAIRLPPNAPATHDENGNISWEGWSDIYRNPMAQLSNRFLVETKNFLLNSVISYTPITRLEFKTNLG